MQPQSKRLRSIAQNIIEKSNQAKIVVIELARGESNQITIDQAENINLSLIPNPQGFKLVWEPLREKLIEELITAYSSAKSEQEFEDLIYKLLYPQNPEFPQVYECSNCQRIAVFARAADSQPTVWYEPKFKGGTINSIHSLVENSQDEEKAQSTQSDYVPLNTYH